MPNRSLINGTVVPESDKPSSMTISSKCPSKWLFVDLETGDIWEHASGQFSRASTEKVETLKQLCKGQTC